MYFDNWKQRCSSLGKIMTNLETVSQKQLDTIKELEERQKLSVMGDAKPLTANMKETLGLLKSQRDAPDSLPTGAKSHLDDVFRQVFWGRREILESKYLAKGNFCEEDSIDLISKQRGKFLGKNEERFFNEFIEGEPDVLSDIIDDAKSNWSLKSFDEAELSTTYEWQIKGYDILTGLTEGSLDYCLVNAPEHLINAEKKRVFYAMNAPDTDNARYIENVRQIERNMIFDVEKFKLENPFYDFDNENLDFSIPECLRIKSFPVSLGEHDEANIIRRVKLCRVYLNEKAAAVEATLAKEAERKLELVA